MAADACDALAASRILTVETSLSRVCKSLCLGGLERLGYAQLIFPRANWGRRASRILLRTKEYDATHSQCSVKELRASDSR